MKYDFSGWATRNDLKCSDGRTIRRNAFKDNDGQTVPLVWNHQHNNPENVLGHALLKNRDEGVYAYCTFNETDAGQNVKSLVEHGDVCALSIYANQLKQKGGDVLHGMIREVSVVLAGANPGAYIDSVLSHDGLASSEEGIIYTGEEISLSHGDVKDEEKEEMSEKEIAEVFETLSDEQKDAVYAVLGKALEDAGIDLDDEEEYEEDDDEDGEEAEDGGDDGEAEADDALGHSDDFGDDETVADVFNTLTEKQKKVVYALIGQALENSEGGNDMKHNVFDNDEREGSVLSHADMEQIFADGKRLGSLRDSVEHHLEDGVLAHADGDEAAGITRSPGTATYGVDGPDMLFPDYREVGSNTPEWIRREQDWVTVFMNGVHHTPFSRIKSTFADITEDEARAKGYMKGKLKKDEVFTLLKRTTDPQTIYKKQKMDRDDIVDITDFDVVAWIKGEMRMMLNEEIARACLIGDGRSSASDDKIHENHVRPVVTDSDLFTIKVPVDGSSTPIATVAKDFRGAAVRARKDYQGSGTPILFTTEELLTEMLLIDDEMGHPLYKTEAELATALRVSRIVTVPVMENTNYYGIILNLSDYNIGADKGGQVALFDDFDIDYNQQKYLIETRISGALTKPYSAIVLYKGGE